MNQGSGFNNNNNKEELHSFPPDELIVNFHDACIYGRDLALLESPTEWLNDSCLHFALQELQQQQQSGGNNAITLFLDPAVVAFFMHQCHDEDDRQEFVQGACRGLDATVHCLVIPINDTLTARDWAVTGKGSHWSLLVLEQVNNDAALPAPSVLAWHFDSLQDSSGNTSVAQAVTDKIVDAATSSDWFGGNNNPRIRVRPSRSPQQTNGHDCGVHVIAAAQSIAQVNRNRISVHAKDVIQAYEAKLAETIENESSCWDIRKEMATRIRHLANKGLPSG